MNKWSLLLFSVLGLLLSTTSEPNFVDGRYGCCERSSSTLSYTRLSIYEPHCAYNTFTEIIQLTSPKRDIRYDPKSIDLKRSSRSDGRRRQFEERRISSDERSRVLNNDVFDHERSTVSNIRARRALREINILQLRRNLKSFSRDNFRENHVERSRSRNNAELGHGMERTSHERVVDIEDESIISANRVSRNDRIENINLKERNQERFTRRTFGIRTNMPKSRENIVENRVNLIQKKEGKREMERSNIDVNTRRKLFRDTRLTSDISKNIQDYRRLSVRDNGIEKMYEREIRSDIRLNEDKNGNRVAYGRNNDEDISKQVLTRNINKIVVIRIQNERFTQLDKGSSYSRTIQRVSEGSENRIREKRLFEERYSTRRVLRQNSNVNSLPEIRHVRSYNDRNIEDGVDNGNVFTKRTERISDQSRFRNIREYNREIRLSEENTSERFTQRNKNILAEKRAIRLNLNNRLSEASRNNVLERREREDPTYRFDYENENIFAQRRIREIRNSHEGDKLRRVRNTQRRFVRNNVIGQEINNNRQIYDNDDTISERRNRNDEDRKLGRSLERERLTRAGIRVSQIRSLQRENQYTVHKEDIRVLNIQANRLREGPNYNRRIVSNTNRNMEKRARTSNDKLGREELRQSLLRGTERVFDESRIRQIKDNHEITREHRLNEERIIVRVLTRIDRNRNNVVERNFVVVLQRRENYEVKGRSVPENERIFDLRRTRHVHERREYDLSNERLAQRNLARLNNMNKAMLSNNRQSYNDENHSKVIFVRKNNREMSKRSERDRFTSINKPSFYISMIQRQDERQLMNRPLARQDSDIHRVVENRRTETPTDRHDFRINLASETKRSFDERRIRQLRDSREYKLNEKSNEERVLTRNVNKFLERQESRIRTEVDVDQNQNTKRTVILLRREKDKPTLMRRKEREFKQSRNGIVRNRREYIRIEDHSRNNRIAGTRGIRNINERINTRNDRNLVMRNVDTEIQLLNSDETHHERRTERVIRNIARYGMDRTIRRMRVSPRTSINNRVSLEGRSEKREDVNRELEYTRSLHGLENTAQRENKINVRSERINNRGRDLEDRARDIRASRLTMTRTYEEKGVRYLAIAKTQSNNPVFEMKLQYIFYLLQGFYILGLYINTTKESDGIQKRYRFSNLFPLFSTLKAY